MKPKKNKLRVYDVPSRPVKVPSSRQVIHSVMRGSTMVNRVIDKNYVELISIGRYGAGLE